MKKLLILISFISFSGFAQSKFQLASNDYRILWKGSNVVGGGHEGLIRLLSASLIISPDRRVTGGEFTMDMNSIKAIDEKNREIPELDEHLKSKDFFDVDRFPKSFFLVVQVDRATSLEPNLFTISGLLTIKEITNKITFPATISIVGDLVKLKANITFNRTKWDIVYQSPNFFANMKDAVISDNIEISAELTLKRVDK